MIRELGPGIIIYSIVLATIIILGILRERKYWLATSIESRLKTEQDKKVDHLLRSTVDSIFSGKKYKVVDNRYRYIVVDDIDIEPVCSLVVYCKTDESILPTIKTKLNSLFERTSNYATYYETEYRNYNTISVFYISVYKKDNSIVAEEDIDDINNTISETKEEDKPRRIYF